MTTVRYIAVGPNKGKTFKLIDKVQFTDGVGEVPLGLHQSYGHVLRDHFGVLPASDVPAEEVKPEQPPAEQQNLDEPARGRRK